LVGQARIEPLLPRSGNCKSIGNAPGGSRARSGEADPLTRPSAPGPSGTGATAKQDAITPGKLGATPAQKRSSSCGSFLRKLALRFVRILQHHSHAHDTRASAHL
jgi:hypothetical protein